MRYLQLLLMLLFAPAPFAFARFVDSRAYAELVADADLVLIVHCNETRKPTFRDEIVPIERHASHMEPVVSEFEVLAVLKGEYKANKLSLGHYKYRSRDSWIDNGPLLARFETKDKLPARVNGWAGTGLAVNDYVLFLKRDNQKRLTFLTGQYDAELSVRQIINPLPATQD